MNQNLSNISEQIPNSKRLHEIIEKTAILYVECDNLSSEISDHQQCFVRDASQLEENDRDAKICPRALMYLIIHVIASKPALFDDDAKKLLTDSLKKHCVGLHGLITRDVLKLLYIKNPSSQTMVWLKYESLLVHLIKDRVYEPKVMSNEILAIIKNELDQNIALKLSSVLKSCVDICRQVSNKHAPDEEEKEKWCEIIDWMSWLMSGNDADMD